MKEVSFFENKNVIVTRSRFIVATKVIEIKNILSVKIVIVKGYTRLKFVLMLVGALLMFFQAGRIIGGVIFLITFLSLYFKQDRFSVCVSTDAGETNSLISEDREYIEQVVKAINAAMWENYLATVP